MALVCKPFGDIITFTRASTGTFFDSAGVLTSAAIDVPRLDYNPSTLAAQGLLIEEQRTNLCLQSEDLATTWSITGTASVSTNVASSPAATTTADKFILGNTITSGNASVVQTFTKAASATTYTVSIFVKAVEFNSLRVILRDTGVAGNNVQAYFNAATGAIASAAVAAGTFTAPSATITAAASGWYRVTLTGTTSTETSIDIRLFVYQNGTGTATGNGTDGILLWGAQLEAGAFPTSYIPTTTTALTRSADEASVNTLSPWFNATAGTIYVEFVIGSTSSTTGFPTAAAFSNGTVNNRIVAAYLTNSTDTLDYFVSDGGAFQAGLSTGVYSAGAVAKMASAYAVNDFAVCRGGGAVGTDTSGTVPAINVFHLGNQISGNQLGGYLRRITYYPRRLSNAELQAITV